MTERGARRVAAAAVAAAALVWVVAAQRSQGVARDEVVYMRAGSNYAAWWIDAVRGVPGARTARRIEAVFGGRPGGSANPEHPPLMKTLFGFSERLFHDRLGWMSELTAYRFPTAVMAALLVALIVSFAGRVWGWTTGAVAGALALLMPRTLFHAGLAAFDLPVMTLWVATLYCYWRALAARRWCVALAVAFGCALATKHNALMLPAVVAPHYAYVAWRRHRHIRGLWRLRPSIWGALAVGGPLVLFASWPHLWVDPIGHAAEWIGFHLRHVHYNYEYLGRNWNAPPFPWHVPLVTTALVVPVATLAAAVIGAVALAARARAGNAADADRAPALLLSLSAAVAIGPFVLRTTPIFGAEKHWMPAFATLAVFAAVGVRAAALAAARAAWPAATRRHGAAVAAVAIAVVAAAAVETVDAHPYALSHYNALAGGAPGGADLGMNRQFWGYAARGVLSVLAERAAARNRWRVYTHDAQPAWPVYARAGLIPPKLRDSGRELPGIRASDFALVIHELHFNRHDYMVWKTYGTVQPIYVLRTDGVPIVSVYERP